MLSAEIFAGGGAAVILAFCMIPFWGPWLYGKASLRFWPLPGDKIYQAAAHLLENDPLGWKGIYPLIHSEGFEVTWGKVLYRGVGFNHHDAAEWALSRAMRKRQAILQELAEASALSDNIVPIRKKA